MPVLIENVLQCDKCGRRSAHVPYGDAFTEAAPGWHRGNGYVLCPQCRLPPFSGPLSGLNVGCAKCASVQVLTRWVPADGQGKRHLCHPTAESHEERMCRTCSHCGFSWDEALPVGKPTSGHAE